MKRLLFNTVCVFICIIFSSLNLEAQYSTQRSVLWSDSFEYTAGSLLTANGWTAHNGTGTNAITVSAGALSYLNYAPSGVGNKVTLATTGEDVNHSFTSTNSGILYAAFMINLTSAQTAGDYFAHFLQSNTTFGGKIFAKSSGTGYQLGVTKAANAGENVVYANTVLNFGTTCLVVLKYEFVTGTTNDLVSLFINPVVGSPEPSTPSATASDITGTDLTSAVGFALRQGNASQAPALALDGIRVATTWSEAVLYQSGTTPTIVVNPTSLNFGNVATGTTSPAQTITVTGANLTGNITWTKSGTGAAAFNITPSSLPATGGTLSVTFSPTAVQSYTATLTISSAGATSQTVTLTGTGITATPTITVNPTSLNLGNIETGTTSPAQTITVTGANLTGNITWTKSGTGANAFNITPTSLPSTGGTLSVTFSPTAVQSYTATLTISSTGATSQTVTLTGTGIAPSGEIVSKWNGYEQTYPNPHDPIFLATGGSSYNNNIATLTRDALGTGYTVNTDGVAASTGWDNATTNEKYWITSFSSIGFTNLTVTSKQRGSNTGPTNFKIQYKVGSGTWTDVANGTITVLNDNYVSGVKTNLPLPSAMNNQATVFLRWICTSTTAIGGGIVAEGGVNRLDVTVRGETTAPTPTIIVNPNSLNFGNVVTGTTSPAQTITVTGIGLTGNITWTKSGTGAAAFNITPTSLPSGGGTLNVTFSPTAVQSYSATLTISSAGATSQTVTLSGTGVTVVVPTITVNPTSLSFGNVETGTTSPAQTITVTGTDLTANITWTKSGTGAAAFNITPASLPATGGTLSVTFSPTAVQSYSATLTISSTGATSQTVTLTGTGVSLPPTANFTSNKTTVFVGENVQFTDLSTSSPTSWSWSFTGGTPTSSTQQNPMITYNTEGSYTVSLTATNANGSDTKTIPNYITVVPQGSNMVCNNSFETWTGGKPDCWFGSKTNFTTANVKQYTVSAHEGTSSCQLIETTDTHKRFTSAVVSVENETTYQIKFWVRGKGDIRTGLFDGRNSGSGYSPYNIYINVNSTSWTQYTQEITAANTSSVAEFIFSVKNTVADNDHIQIDDVEIIPKVPASGLTVTPESLTFGFIMLGTTSPEKTLTVSGTDLTGDITYTKDGDDAAAFTVTPATWNPATGGTLTVTFSPTEEREYNANIIISSPGVDSKIVPLSGKGTMSSDNFFEDFEDMTGNGSYSGAEVTFASGLWYIKGYTTMDQNDRHNGTRSIRLRGATSDVEHRAEMMFDKLNGAGTVSFKYGSYSSHSGGELQLQISTDQSATWIDKGDVITVPSWTDGGNVLQTAQIEVNTDGNIRIRIIKVNAKASSSVNIDDIEITNYGASTPSISVSPASLTFGSVIVQTISETKTLSVTGYNLTGNITYAKNGDDADAFTITETSWNPATGGTLAITFAPTEIKPYTATITFNSEGATPKTVTISGTGGSGNIVCNGGFEEWTNGKPNCWWGDKTTFAKANVVQYNANVHGGNFACQLINTDSGHKRFSTQPVTVIAKKEYTITFWVRGKGEIRTALFDAREGNNGYTPYTEWTSIDSDTWEQYTQTATAETNATNAEFIFSIRNTDENGNHIQLDDVEIFTKNAIVETPSLHCTVFPNPSKGIFNVTTNSKVNISVYSLIGVLILEQQINETGTLNLETRPAGIYIMKITDDKQGSAIRKLIVQ